MELRHLKYFVAVAEELSFSRAAAKLNIAQPPLSMQIKDLENEIGVPLFYRTKRQVGLTNAGEIYLQQVCRILADIEKACDDAQRAYRGELGQLIVGFAGIATFEILPKVISAYRAAYPLIDLTLHQLGTSEQVQALNESKLHIGILCLPIPAAKLSYKVVRKESFVAALPKNHVLAARRQLDIQELSEELFVMTTRKVGQGYHDLIINLCHKAGFCPRISQEVHELQTTATLIAAGMGIALVPESMENLPIKGVVYRRLTNSIPILETALAWREDEASPVVEHFLEFAVKALAIQ